MGSSSPCTSRLTDITRTPSAVTGGRMPMAFPSTPPAGRPNNFGMLGPVMSASSTPTLRPRRARAAASRAVTEDLPTPPLPLITATTCLTWLNWASLGGAGGVPPNTARRSSGVISPWITSTPVTPGKASTAWRALFAICSLSGQPRTVKARVNLTLPAWVADRLRTMPSSTILRPSSGSITRRSASKISFSEGIFICFSPPSLPLRPHEGG